MSYGEEPPDELCDAGEGRPVALVLRQAAAEQPQPALPHLDGQGASGGQELRALGALLVSDSQRLHGRVLRTGVSQRVKHKHNAQPGEQQDDPAVTQEKKFIQLIKV